MKIRIGNKKKNKRVLATILTMVMSVGLLSGVLVKKMEQVQAATTLLNPRLVAGVTTWDCVYFGRYAQSDATGATKEPIKWRVLSVNGFDAFLMADCNLDAQQYHTEFAEVTWEQSLMRSWLNGYSYTSNLASVNCTVENFIDKAFYEVEQNAILTTTVSSSSNPKESTTSGNSTSDKIYILSYEEVTNAAYGFASDYSTADPARKRVNTAFVGAGGSTKNNSTIAAGQYSYWRLRTPGRVQNNTLIVTAAGVIDDKNLAGFKDKFTGTDVSSGKHGVCPVLHLDLTKTDVWSYAGTVNNNGVTTPGDPPPTVLEKQETVEDPNTGAEYEVTAPETNDRTVEYKGTGSETDEIVIPDSISINGLSYKVTSIADNAFKNNKKIKSVKIGANITSIGKNAFSGCSKLQTVTIGSNLTSIGAKAFYKCTKLKKITIPSKVNTIGKQAFDGCKNLKKITIKTKLLTKKKIGSKAFKGIYSMATIKVPKVKLSTYKKILKLKGVSSKAKIKK